MSLVATPWQISPHNQFPGLFFYIRYLVNTRDPIMSVRPYYKENGGLVYESYYHPTQRILAFTSPREAMNNVDEYARNMKVTLLNEIQYQKMKCML